MISVEIITFTEPCFKEQIYAILSGNASLRKVEK